MMTFPGVYMSTQQALERYTALYMKGDRFQAPRSPSAIDRAWG